MRATISLALALSCSGSRASDEARRGMLEELTVEEAVRGAWEVEDAVRGADLSQMGRTSVIGQLVIEDGACRFVLAKDADPPGATLTWIATLTFG